MKYMICTAALLLAAPAMANDKQDFSDCDGRIHPGKQDDGMRGEASVSRFDSLGLGAGLSPALLGAVRGLVAENGRIAACTRALASPRLLPTQVLRKAHLLRARGTSHLQRGDVDLALLDLDAAEAALADRAADPFYQRSMGASLKLLRAIALAQQEKWAEASSLAAAVRDVRPYSLRLQNVSAAILGAAPLTAGAASPWGGLLRLDPDMGHRALQDEARRGNHAAVLRLAPAVDLKLDFPDPQVARPGFYGGYPVAALNAVLSGFAVANARAATGDVAGAKRFREALAEKVADRKAKLEAIRAATPPPLTPAPLTPAPLAPATAAPAPATPAAVAPAPATPAPAPATPAQVAVATGGPPPPAPPSDPIVSMAEQRLRQLDLRLAQVEGRMADAKALALSGALPMDAGTAEIFTALNAALPVKERLPAIDLSTSAKAGESSTRLQLRSMAALALVAPETPRTVIDYNKSRPNILGALVGGALSMGTSLLGGIDRTDGFRSTQQTDGTIKVEYVGNTPSEPLVQEMTLLRAAETARAAGKWGFLIARRADYTRYMVTSQYGAEISRVPTGHKTELFIRYLDEGEDPVRGFSAIGLIDALGPLYYEDKPAKR
ncbi:MAG: hypothetical protein U9R07_03070 [Pseudomonadota bacterium]|nr:hypothetical protein [Pseudomonadota bacterium]